MTNQEISAVLNQYNYHNHSNWEYLSETKSHLGHNYQKGSELFYASTSNGEWICCELDRFSAEAVAEKLVRDKQEEQRPELKTLFGLATTLTTGQINQLISTIEHYE